MKFVADAHCDLLSYLQTVANASPLAKECRCSIPLLEQGGVFMQTTAIFTFTKPGSTQLAAGQVEKFISLLKNYPERVWFPSTPEQYAEVFFADRIALIPAIENASGFCEENEPIADGLKRLATMQTQLGRIFYISLTHHTENRFGGGNYTQVGLKEDGKRLLDFLAGKQIAVDLSHASDALAYDILTYLDREKLPLQVLASHSNFRTIHYHPRNLPDDLAIEIARRKGIVGLTWLKAYVGNSYTDLFRHFTYGCQLGVPMACGADLFYYLPEQFPQGVYFDRYSNASHYFVLNADMTEQNAEKAILENFFAKNLHKFIKKLWFSKD